MSHSGNNLILVPPFLSVIPFLSFKCAASLKPALNAGNKKCRNKQFSSIIHSSGFPPGLQPEERRWDFIGLDGQWTVTACSKTLVHWDTNNAHLGHIGRKSRLDQEKPGFSSMAPIARQESTVCFSEKKMENGWMGFLCQKMAENGHFTGEV